MKGKKYPASFNLKFIMHLTCNITLGRHHLTIHNSRQHKVFVSWADIVQNIRAVSGIYLVYLLPRLCVFPNVTSKHGSAGLYTLSAHAFTCRGPFTGARHHPPPRWRTRVERGSGARRVGGVGAQWTRRLMLVEMLGILWASGASLTCTVAQVYIIIQPSSLLAIIIATYLQVKCFSK